MNETLAMADRQAKDMLLHAEEVGFELDYFV